MQAGARVANACSGGVRGAAAAACAVAFAQDGDTDAAIYVTRRR